MDHINQMKGTVENPTAVVLSAVDDIFFSSKIADTARRVGVELVQALDARQLAEQLALRIPRLIILDLNSKACLPLEAIRRIKTDAKLQRIPVVGFFSHVQIELQRGALEAGCDHVMPRSAFTANLPKILQMVRIED